MGCNAPVEYFLLDSVRSERYVKFVIRSFFSLGGGLQYIDFEFGMKIMNVNKCKKDVSNLNTIFEMKRNKGKKELRVEKDLFLQTNLEQHWLRYPLLGMTLKVHSLFTPRSPPRNEMSKPFNWTGKQ